MHEGMRIAVDELHQLSFELDLLVDVVGGAVGMVRVCGGAGDQRKQDQSACGFTHHFFSSLRSAIDASYGWQASREGCPPKRVASGSHREGGPLSGYCFVRLL